MSPGRSAAAETLRAARTRGEQFDGRFFEASPHHEPIAPAAAVFADRADWPAPEEYVLAFGGRSPTVRFETMIPRKRRAREKPPVDVESMYDARIVRGVVPTRARCWHDYLNALVWATFPEAKRALHEKQYAMMRAWATPGAANLPNARTREQDAVALIDEGGVLLLRGSDGERAVAFGHALFEGLVYRTPSMIARGVPLAVDGSVFDLELVDRALALLLRSASLTPEMLPRHPLS